MMDYTGLMACIDVVGNTLVQEKSNRTFRTWCSRPRAGADNTVSGAVARTPEEPTTTPLWCPDTRGVDERLPHIHHNRLNLHILIHSLLTTFTA
jgi:hypothetical protein